MSFRPHKELSRYQAGSYTISQCPAVFPQNLDRCYMNNMTVYAALYRLPSVSTLLCYGLCRPVLPVCGYSSVLRISAATGAMPGFWVLSCNLISKDVLLVGQSISAPLPFAESRISRTERITLATEAMTPENTLKICGTERGCRFWECVYNQTLLRQDYFHNF